MRASALAQVLRQLPPVRDRDLLVGFDTADDAGVYRVTGEKAVITTLDFFPPIVDDPYLFGQIAAANAVSDVYAMGGSPRFAMNIVCFPPRLGLDVLHEIIRGSAEKLREAGAFVIGGHSIVDKELKYGLSVVGFARPEGITRNSAARPGDVLVLTKSIGVGVITTALKARRLKERDAKEPFASMATLNRGASEAMVEAGAKACTDVTGYGLIGHAMEMALASNVNLVIRADDIEVFDAAMRLVKNTRNRPGIIKGNRDFFRKEVFAAPHLDEAKELLLYDPQTSGGLLISIAGERLQKLMDGLARRRVRARVIGSVVERAKGFRIRVE